MRSERRLFSAMSTLTCALPASISPRARSAAESFPLAVELAARHVRFLLKRSRSSSDSMIALREKSSSSVSSKVSARSSSSLATSRSRTSERAFFAALGLRLVDLGVRGARSAWPSAASFCAS